MLAFADTEKYCAMAASVVEARYAGHEPLAFVHTYGCQGNVADSEQIKGLLIKMGYKMTDTPDDADFILYNTCAVREHAEDRVFGNVGALKHLKRRRPGMIIALCGCMVQQQHIADRFKESYPYVNLIFGTHLIPKFPELLYRVLTGGKRIFELDQSDNTIVEGLPVERDNSIRGWLPVMYGCDNFCSYCIVPHVRGRERSRRSDVIIAQAKEMISLGYKDITLLGQNVNSYGKKEEGELTFPELITELDKIEGEYWLRFMTSHPKDCTKELIDAMAASKHMAHHIHLPFQSGSNRILKEMNRKYTIEHYKELVAMAREAMPDVSLTSDVIVGFPGETREEFEETLSAIEEIGFTSLFTFIYSPREGTPAASMPDPVSYEEKSKWLRELITLQESIAAKKSASMVGSKQRVLVEGMAKNGLLSCRTSTNIIIEAEGAPELIGSFADAEVTTALNWILRGKII